MKSSMTNYLAIIALPLALAFAAIYLLLPRPRPVGRKLATSGAAAALLAGGWWLIRPGAANPETVLFYVFAGLAVFSGGMLITQRNPVHAALSFALMVLSTCGLFLLQGAPFLTAATIIVYAGAIVVTFLFVIMLAQQAGLSDADARSREPLLSVLAGIVLLGALLYSLETSFSAGWPENELSESLRRKNVAGSPGIDEFGRMELPAQNVAAVGRTLFTDYLIPVELGGTLLLVATVGAIVIAGRRRGGLR